MSPDYSDDEGSMVSYDDISPARHSSQSYAFVRDLVARIPGKQKLDDDEMPDVLYTAQYCSPEGRVIGSE